MSKRDFIESPEWQLIAANIKKAIAGAQAEILVTNDILKVKEIAGGILAMQGFINLPDQLLHDESDALLNEPTDSVRLTPLPKRTPTRVF